MCENCYLKVCNDESFWDENKYLSATLKVQLLFQQSLKITPMDKNEGIDVW